MAKTVEDRLSAIGKWNRKDAVKKYTKSKATRARHRTTSGRRYGRYRPGDRAFRQGETIAMAAIYEGKPDMPQYSKHLHANKRYEFAIQRTIANYL